MIFRNSSATSDASVNKLRVASTHPSSSSKLGEEEAVEMHQKDDVLLNEQFFKSIPQ